MRYRKEPNAHEHGDLLKPGYGTAVGSLGGESEEDDPTLIMVCADPVGDTFRVELWHRNLYENPNIAGPGNIASYREAVDAAYAFVEHRIATGP